nr:hypothetical protein Iba_chr11aCG15380 [Ipomoea batatas]GMD57336.1 hypothetical protein Iba_chr11eCG11790 [Ipomoea batatas]
MRGQLHYSMHGCIILIEDVEGFLVAIEGSLDVVVAKTNRNSGFVIQAIRHSQVSSVVTKKQNISPLL